MFSPMSMPLEIVGLLRSTLTIEWEDGHSTVYSARELRIRCRCAECVEEMTGRPLLDPSSVAPDVRARAIRVVGQYAIQIEWSDNHKSGIYTFRLLRANCPCADCAKIRAAEGLPA